MMITLVTADTIETVILIWYNVVLNVLQYIIKIPSKLYSNYGRPTQKEVHC